MNRQESLLLKGEIINALEKISGRRICPLYNDIYKTKAGETRRLKVVFRGADHWINKSESSKWNAELQKLYPGVEFVGVNKLKAIWGGLKAKEELRAEFIETGIGTAKEYDFRFDNEDYYFVIRIKY